MRANMTTVYLVTGTNKGIGRGIVTSLLLRPDTTVLAAVRDPASESSQSLLSLPKSPSTTLHILTIDSANPVSALLAFQTLQTLTPSVNHLDVLIANAGIARHIGPVINVPIPVITEHLNVNAFAPLLLFQAFWPLLQNSSNPKFIVITSEVGSISQMDPNFPLLAYGISKVAANYLTMRIHLEHEELIAFPLNPGWVATAMGNAGANSVGMESAPLSVEDSVVGCLDLIDHATKEETSGTFRNFDGAVIPW